MLKTELWEPLDLVGIVFDLCSEYCSVRDIKSPNEIVDRFC